MLPPDIKGFLNLTTEVYKIETDIFPIITKMFSSSRKTNTTSAISKKSSSEKKELSRVFVISLYHTPQQWSIVSKDEKSLPTAIIFKS